MCGRLGIRIQKGGGTQKHRAENAEMKETSGNIGTPHPSPLVQIKKTGPERFIYCPEFHEKVPMCGA